MGHQAPRPTGQRAWMARGVMRLPSPSPVSLQTPLEPGRVSCRSLEVQPQFGFPSHFSRQLWSSAPDSHPSESGRPRVYHWQGVVRRALSRPQPPARCPGTGELQQSRLRMQLHVGSSLASIRGLQDTERAQRDLSTFDRYQRAFHSNRLEFPGNTIGAYHPHH